MLELADRWVWDSWPIDDGPDHHLFYLQAPRTQDPDGRHRRANVGHAVSSDQEHWTVLADALRPAPGPAWDDLAIWTGSALRGPDGTWHLFYSALSRAENGLVQRIGRADSPDLVTWTRAGDGPLVEADPRWYEAASSSTWPDVAWRDPYVFADPAGEGWHMLVTARGREGGPGERGVVGHAWSPDLATWEVRPPLTSPAGFSQLEVASTTYVQDRWLLLFCCMAPELDDRRRAETPNTGMWSAPAASPLGPFDLTRAAPFDDPNLYAAHLVTTPSGEAALLGFTVLDGGTFAGRIGPPVPVVVTEEGTLLTAGQVSRQPSTT